MKSINELLVAAKELLQSEEEVRTARELLSRQEFNKKQEEKKAAEEARCVRVRKIGERLEPILRSASEKAVVKRLAHPHDTDSILVWENTDHKDSDPLDELVEFGDGVRLAATSIEREVVEILPGYELYVVGGYITHSSHYERDGGDYDVLYEVHDPDRVDMPRVFLQKMRP